MAQLRLAALTLLATACAPAAAGQPSAPPTTASGLTAPVGWQVLPELAKAVAGAAKADGIVVEGSEAWGEPARGCYAAWIALRGSDANVLIVEDALAGLAAEKFAMTNVIKPTSDGVLAFGFERAPYRGRVRARLDGGHLAALACFANEREPASCELPCTALLGSAS
ncbi:MAG: hypothetical protein H0T79_15520 [Deltaproteobacteria bacterium]|nr:hypothetical protein [Deltaproteobacteria bacterium]